MTELSGSWFSWPDSVERTTMGSFWLSFLSGKTVCWAGDLFLVAPVVSRARVDGSVLSSDPNVIGNSWE